MAVNLSKIISIMKQTGDRYIIQDGNSVFVLMPFDEYTLLLNQKKINPDHIDNLSEEDFLSKINTEIAEWRLTQPETNIDVDFSQELDNNAQEEIEEEQYYLEPVD